MLSEAKSRQVGNNKLLILIILFCFLCSGCKVAEYRGTIKSYDPNGLLLTHTEVVTNKPAMIKDGPVEFDGRGGNLGEFIKDVFGFIFQMMTLNVLAD